jgi:hypothetical protein
VAGVSSLSFLAAFSDRRTAIEPLVALPTSGHLLTVMKPVIEGGCVCGGVRYRLEAAPTQVNDCHCLDCRRSSGAPFVGHHGREPADLPAQQLGRLSPVSR